MTPSPHARAARRASYVGALVLAATVLAAGSAAAQGVGAKYGARDPMKCASKTEPKQGAPSAAQAAMYMRCTLEKESGGQLRLLENITVQVAPKGRKFNAGMESAPEIDPTEPIYELRGGFVQYTCDPENKSGMFENVGKNCFRYDEPNAKGSCYKTTFAEWYCWMSDADARYPTPKVAPPKGR